MAVPATRHTTTKSPDQQPPRPRSAPPPAFGEPLKTSTHHNAGEVFHGAYCRTLLLIEDGLFEVVPGILSGIGLRHFGERRLGKEVQATSGVPLTCTSPTYPKGYARRVQRR